MKIYSSLPILFWHSFFGQLWHYKLDILILLLQTLPPSCIIEWLWSLILSSLAENRVKWIYFFVLEQNMQLGCFLMYSKFQTDRSYSVKNSSKNVILYVPLLLTWELFAIILYSPLPMTSPSWQVISCEVHYTRKVFDVGKLWPLLSARLLRKISFTWK